MRQLIENNNTNQAFLTEIGRKLSYAVRKKVYFTSCKSQIAYFPPL